MFFEILKTLNDGIHGIDILINERIQRSKASNIKCGSWKLDDDLKTGINNIKSYSESLSKTCIKLVLLINSKATSEIIQSIATELHELCATTIGSYFVFLKFSVSDCLFDYVSRAVRVLLFHTKDLIIAISSNNVDSINMHAGMISKISDENQKLPLANRLAYRRFILERCSGVKETVKEFEEYIEEYRIASEEAIDSVFQKVEQLSLEAGQDAQSHEDNEKEDDEDSDYDHEDDDEQAQYSEAEVALVVTSVSLMKLTLQCNKTVLGAVTVVSDSLVAAMSMEGLAADDLSALHVLEERSQVWVGALARLTDSLQDRTVDLGAELYPPLEDRATIADMYNALLDCLKQTVDLLLAVEFASHLSAELVTAVDLLRVSMPVSMVVTKF